MQDTIDQIDVWACCVPLPAPLQFGTFSVTARRYVAAARAYRWWADRGRGRP